MSAGAAGAVLRAAAAALIGCTLTACSVTGLEEREASTAKNACDSDSDCGGEGVCRASVCVESNGMLSSLLVEVAPSGNATSLAGQQFFSLHSNLPSDGGALGLRLDEVALSGRVQASIPAGCDPVFVGKQPGEDSVGASLSGRRASDLSIPVQVSFLPRVRRLGIPVQAGLASVPATQLADRATAYSYGLNLPGGSYDVYVLPFEVDPRAAALAPDGRTCALAPQLILGERIESGGTGKADYVISMPEPKQLALEVRWPETAEDLRGWSADMIEDREGRVISNRVALGLASTRNGVRVYSVTLAYNPVLDKQQEEGDPAARELVRLTPPEGVIAPTVLFDRSAIELFSPGRGVIEQLPSLGTPVTVEGFVLDTTSSRLISARLAFVATELAGAAPGTLVSFSASAATRPNSELREGTFSVELLPGTYRVYAVADAPTASGVVLGTAQAEWAIAPTPATQAGRVIELSPAVALSGRAVLRSGEGARGAIVTAETATWTATTTTLERELSGVPLVPQATSTTIVDGDGQFTLWADPGVFDLSVRTPEGSGLAWFVQPGLGVFATRDLREVVLPHPVRLRAAATFSAGNADAAELTGARVRAYALLGADGTPTDDIDTAKSAIAVAESRLTADATTTIFVPASLDGPD